jgi:hypothetical protein
MLQGAHAGRGGNALWAPTKANLAGQFTCFTSQEKYLLYTSTKAQGSNKGKPCRADENCRQTRRRERKCLTPPYMCRHTSICVSSHLYICVLILLCVVIPLYASSYLYIWCPHTVMCPHTSVSSYLTSIRVLIPLYMCPHTSICVPIPLYRCPHTSIYVPSYVYRCVSADSNCGDASYLYVYSYLYACVLIPPWMCPHTTTYVSSYQ